jgi:alcohol dehydrogenase
MGIPGVTFDGDYADLALVKSNALAAIPDGLADEDAAPAPSSARHHDLQRPAQFGRPRWETWSPFWRWEAWATWASSSPQSWPSATWQSPEAPTRCSWQELARELGAHDYIDSTAGNPGEALQAMGGAKVILSTISSGEANTEVLGPRGELIAVGASPHPIEASPGTLIGGNLTISGRASGSSMDSQDTSAFSSLTGIRPRIEALPLEKPARPTPKCSPATQGSAWS